MASSSAILTVERFKSASLNNERRLFVYLPPGYDREAGRRYPVLYMHAGQRAFAPQAPGAESWNVHLAADRLIEAGAMEPILIVAIAHVRPVVSNEYYHFIVPAEEAPGISCAGLAYEDFLLNEVKPYIDARFRTLPEPGHTGLMGSSAGALSTYHIGLRNPDVFGNLAMLSPYFVKARLDERSPSGLQEEVLYRRHRAGPDQKVWLDIGDAEGLFLPRHVLGVVRELQEDGLRRGERLAFLEQPKSAHQEADWGERVHLPLLFLFGRIGRPVSLELVGRTRIGLAGGHRVRVNALLRYDSGFARTVLDGEYDVANPEVLEVRPDGAIVPKKPGTTAVTLAASGLTASAVYEVVPELSATVRVEMTADVPPEEDPADAIYGGMGMRLVRAGDGRYAGSFIVPRDSGYRFRFTRGFRRFETRADGGALPNRAFRASDDTVLHYKVDRWEDVSSRTAERRSLAGPAF